MTEVTPILENTRFSSIFEYNRFMTPLLWPGDFIALIVFSKGNKFQRISLVKIITYCPLWFLYHRFIIGIAEREKRNSKSRLFGDFYAKVMLSQPV